MSLRVNVYADRNRIDERAKRDERQYPVMEDVMLPFMLAPGDTFYPNHDFVGMTVLRREATADNLVPSLIVDGNMWDLHELENAGFKVKL